VVLRRALVTRVGSKGLGARVALGLALVLGAGTPLLLAVGSPSVAAAATPPPAGSVLAWGANGSTNGNIEGTGGFLGIGTATGPDTCVNSVSCSTSPVQTSVPAGTVVSSVTSKHFSSLAVTAEGSLLAWGDNRAGQLGVGTASGPETCDTNPCSTIPVSVHLPAGTVVTAVATGHEFDLALTSTSQVYAWGSNRNGQLGQGNTTDSSTPVPVPLPAGAHVVALAAGHDTSYALDSSGIVYAWGSNEGAALGIGNDTGPSMCNGNPCSTTPVAVLLPAGTAVTAIAAGADHALALTSSGGILAWGDNGSGQLGVGNTTQQDSPVPVSTPAGVTFSAVAAGHFFSLALTTGGAVYAWGFNGEGQLGVGTAAGPAMCSGSSCSTTPLPVSMPAGVTVVAVDGGSEHSLALTSAGQVYAWGGNFFGQLGIGNDTGPDMCGGEGCSTTPVAVPLPGGASAKAIAAGNYYSLVVVGTPPGRGYWLGASDGGVFAEGNAPFDGSLGNLKLNQPMVGMAATPGGQGYWLVASDGGVFTEGNAQFYGSLGATKLNKPIVGMAPTPDGHGYWLVASDGGVFSEGDAQFFGSAGAIHLNQPVVGMAVTPDGGGYWLVAADGGIFDYGDAGFFGSAGAIHLNKPVVGMASTPTGLGYWLVASDGGIFNYGDAGFFGSAGALALNKPVVGMAHSPSGKGYWLVASDGGIFNYGDAGFFGSTGGIVLNKPIVGMAIP
jgi:alpha-tubulin suppressor-like RCC1 family protein